MAAFDGIPRSAIGTGAVNLVLPIAQMPQALMRYARHPYMTAGAWGAFDAEEAKALDETIALLRARTSREFTHCRRATLLRRIRRRMAAAGIEQIIGQLSAFFDTASAPLRIFRRIGQARPRERAFTPEIGEQARFLWPRLAGRPEHSVPGLVEAAQRALLDICAPATALVDRNYRAFYYWGLTDRHMRAPPPGEPSRDALRR